MLQGIQIICLCFCSWKQRACIIYPPQYKHTWSKMYNRYKHTVHCVWLDPSKRSIWPKFVLSQMSKCQSVCVRLYPEMIKKQMNFRSFREATFVWKAFSSHKAEERKKGWLITEKDVAEDAVFIFSVSRRVQLFLWPKWPTVNFPCLYCEDLLAYSLKRRWRIFCLVVRGMWNCLLQPCLDFHRFCSENLHRVYPMYERPTLPLFMRDTVG